MTDWTLYVRRFPWATVAIAALAGFALIPRKKSVISPDQEALAEMVRKKQLRLDVDHKAEKKQGMLGTVAAAVMAYAAKASMTYVGERMRAAAMNKAQEGRPAAPASSSEAFNAPIMH